MKPRYGLQDALPSGRAALLGLQHVLAMFVGIITPPLLIARELKLGVTETAFLVSMSLFTSGITTYIQVHRFGPLGSGLLSVQGTSFVFVGVAIQTGHTGGMPLVFGMALAAAFVPILVSRFIGLAQRVFPPVVTGSVVLLIGVSLIKVGFAEMAGGFGAPDFGHPANLLLGLFVMATIILLHAYGRGFTSTLSIALGLLSGYMVAVLLGRVDVSAVWRAAWVAPPTPMPYALSFDPMWLIPWLVAYLTTTIECVGDLTATSSVSGEPVSGPLFVERVKGGVLADGVGCVISCFFGGLPKTTFAQNNGVIAMTGVAARRVGVMVALLLVGFGLFPKLAALVAIMPQPVLGGATVIMFAMVGVAGIEIVARGGLSMRKHFIMAITMALGLGVTMVPEAVEHVKNLDASSPFGQALVRCLGIILDSGLAVGTLTAIFLNFILPEDADEMQ